MAINGSFTRQSANPTETKATAFSAVVIEGGGVFTVDIKNTINGQPRLALRLNIEPVISGDRVRCHVQQLNFESSGSQVYADSKATPFSDDEADSVGAILKTETVNLNVLWTNAGEPPT